MNNYLIDLTGNKPDYNLFYILVQLSIFLPYNVYFIMDIILLILTKYVYEKKLSHYNDTLKINNSYALTNLN